MRKLNISWKYYLGWSKVLELNACMRFGLMVFASLALLGCSLAPKKNIQVSVPNEQWWFAALSGNDLDTRKLAQVRQGILSVSNRNFILATTKDPEINAYALMEQGQPLIVMTTGFLTEFGSDQDVLASVMGHELAHHALGHTEPGYLENRNLTVQAVSTTVGMISSFFIPFSGLLTGNAVRAAGLSYSRDDEREADLLGMQWAIRAGYSPCGGYRFAQRLDVLNKGASITMLSTHPGLSERMESFRLTSLNAGGDGCLVANKPA